MGTELSIIVPVYNAEYTLERCITSIQKQTFKNFELILVDDGSTDNSYLLCCDFASKDKRIKVVHKKNGGQSSARNLGLSIAKGQFIGFVDADDMIAHNMYEYTLRLINEYNADIAICAYTNKLKDFKKAVKEKILVLNNEMLMKYFYRMNKEQSNYSVWNRVYNKECIQGIFFLEKRITEDVMFTYESYRNARKVILSNQIKYFYDLSNSSITKKQLCLKDLDLLYIWDRIIEKEKDSKYFKFALTNRRRATFTLYVKSVLFGKNTDITKKQLEDWSEEILKNKSELFKVLDWKRKLLLVAIIIGVI